MGVPAVGRSPGALVTPRGAGPYLALLFGWDLVGWACVAGLVFSGAIPGLVGWLPVVLWLPVASVVRLWSADRAWESGHRRWAAALATAEVSRLSARVVSLYSRRTPGRPDEEAGSDEVFALYRQALWSLEVEGDPRLAGELAERGILLADGLLDEDAPYGSVSETEPGKEHG